MFRVFQVLYLVFVGMIFVSSLAFASGSPAKNSIVIIHSYNLQLAEWVGGQEDGFKQVLGDGFDYHTMFMNTKNIPVSQFQDAAREALSLIIDKQPQLVYVTDDNALKLVGRYVNNQVPVIFSGINANIRKDYPWILTSKNITGVLEKPIIKRTLTEMERLIGVDISKVLIILGKGVTGEAFFTNDLGAKISFEIGEREINVARSGQVQEWKRLILESKSKGYTCILIGGIFGLDDEVDGKNSGYELARWASLHTPLPIISVQRQVVGQDMFIGGMFMSGESMGKSAGEIAEKVLGGKKPRSIFPNLQLSEERIISKAQLKKWGLNIKETDSNKLILID